MKKHLRRLGITTRPYLPGAETPFHLIAHYRRAEKLSQILEATFLSALNLKDIEMNRLLHYAKKADLLQCSIREDCPKELRHNGPPGLEHLEISTQKKQNMSYVKFALT